MADSPLNETLLDEKLTTLEAARTWSPRVISKLETLIRTGSDESLFRVNPFQYAAEKNVSSTEAIDLFLHAAKIGLFEMDWHLICPSCAHVVESFGQLTHLHSHSTCQACYVDFDATLDDYIQVMFTLSPRIRSIQFHTPQTLSAEDFFMKYHMSQEALAAEGVKMTDVFRGLTRLFTYIAPGETLRFEADINPGLLQLQDFTKNPLLNFIVTPERSVDAQELRIQVVNGRYLLLERPTFAVEAQDGPFVHKAPYMSQIASGPAVLYIENQMSTPTPLWIMNSTMVSQAVLPLQFTPHLSGKQLLTTQTFRTLFRTETVSTEEGISVKDITFLFTDLKGSTAMYDAIGDPKAYFLVRQHFDTLGRVIAENGGSIVKTIGDAVMATFMNPVNALKASQAMIRDIQAFNQTISTPLHLKIGIHSGHSIVVTLNERLDYFGQTVNIAARVQGLADADEIYMTQEAFAAPGMTDALKNCQVSREQVVVKGVSDALHVHRVTLA